MTEAVHPSPVWRDRSNFIIGVTVDPAGTDVASEQLWARKGEDGTFEVCCIPFFAYDVALGDRVLDDDEYNVVRVVSPSGRYVFRAYLDLDQQKEASRLEEWLESESLLFEWSSASLVSIDAPDLPSAQALGAELVEREQRGELLMETGKTART